MFNVSQRTSFTKAWKMAGALVSLNGITRSFYWLLGALKTVSFPDSYEMVGIGKG